MGVVETLRLVFLPSCKVKLILAAHALLGAPDAHQLLLPVFRCELGVVQVYLLAFVVSVGSAGSD